MQKQMCTGVKFVQLSLRKKAHKMHVSGNAEAAGKHFQLRLQRAFAGNHKFRVRVVLLENCKSAQARCHAFLGDQPARLHDLPFAVSRRFSVHQWKLIQRDSSAINAKCFRGAPKLSQSIGKRLRTREHERDGVEKTPKFARIIFNLWFMRDVRAVERYNAWLVPLLDKWKQVHAGMAEINVHQISSVAPQQ